MFGRLVCPDFGINTVDIADFLTERRCRDDQRIAFAIAPSALRLNWIVQHFIGLRLQAIALCQLEPGDTLVCTLLFELLQVSDGDLQMRQCVVGRIVQEMRPANVFLQYTFG